MYQWLIVAGIGISLESWHHINSRKPRGKNDIAPMKLILRGVKFSFKSIFYLARNSLFEGTRSSLHGSNSLPAANTEIPSAQSGIVKGT